MRLLSIEEIQTNWHLISYGAAKTSGADNTSAYLLGLAKSLLSSKSQCWFLEKDSQVRLMLITRIIEENDVKKMIITNMYGFKTSGLDDYAHVIDELCKEAKNIGADEILGYMTNDRVIALAERNGFSRKYTVVTRQIDG